MKTLAVLLSLVSLSAFAQSYPAQTRLSDLPDGARLKVKADLELTETQYDHFVNHTGFENGKQELDADVTELGATQNSQVIIRTNQTTSLTRKTVSGLVHNYGANFLKAGTYCLTREKSDFDSHHTWMIGTAVDRLFFNDCSSDEPAFVVYAIAGYTLRRSSGYNGFNIHQFDFQTGKAIEFIR